eukprot:TRINITY_DN7356_c0_g4_i2.p2 TRINITY_DN7356_c0_g4~~TRINITY_DN7356_c0_g4_i2.p2  ORF type:complete len:146 (+),score=22.52 TRINITY_DN7356_c0_g4_i2:629-1066(+)
MAKAARLVITDVLNAQKPNASSRCLSSISQNPTLYQVAQITVYLVETVEYAQDVFQNLYLQAMVGVRDVQTSLLDAMPAKTIDALPAVTAVQKVEDTISSMENVFNAQKAVTSALILIPVSYTHLRAHETPEHLVCRLLLEKKKI